MVTRTRKRLDASLLALAFIAVASSPAHAGIALAMEEAAPGSTDVLLRFATDAAAVPPFTLLRRELAPGVFASDVLPLDPLADAYLRDIASSPVIVSGEGIAGTADSMRVYQLVDAAGSCSNAGYVVTTDATYSQKGQRVFAPEARSGYVDARAILARIPQAVRVRRWRGDCTGPWLEREPDGTLVGENFVLARREAVIMDLAHHEGVVVVGAAASKPTTLEVGGAASCSMTMAWPQGTSLHESHELLCGKRGTDWSDANLDGKPDTCPAGIFAGGPERAAVGRLDFGDTDDVVRWDYVEERIPSRFVFGSDFALSPGTVGWFAVMVPTRIVDTWDAGAQAGCACADSDGDGVDDCSEILQGSDPADATSSVADADADGVADDVDDCPTDPDSAQSDRDLDGRGDACDPCADDAADACTDPDADGLAFGHDNCPSTWNRDQRDTDHDLAGDACDDCPSEWEPTQRDTDGDGFGDWCDDCPAGEATSQPEVQGLTVGWSGSEVLLQWDDGRGPWDLATGPLADLLMTRGLAGATCLAMAWPYPGLRAASTGTAWFLVRSSGQGCHNSWGDGAAAWLTINSPCP